MKLDTILQHKHLKHIFITLIGYTKKGYKVTQTDLPKEPRSRKRAKSKIAYFSEAEVKDLFTITSF